MLFAQYGWGVGAGLAYLLLLFLSIVGLTCHVVLTFIRFETAAGRGPSKARVFSFFGFIQPWFVYLFLNALPFSPTLWEVLWLISMVVVLMSFAMCAFAWGR